MASPLRIRVIIGSTRPKRFSEKPAAWITGKLKERPNLDVQVLDLRDFDLPFYNEPVNSSSIKGNYTSPESSRWAKAIGEADGFVIVTPEYNRGTSGVLKNALDLVYDEWNIKPVGFVSYGSAGGARAMEQLRLTSLELQMVPIRSGIHIFSPMYTAATEGDPYAFDPLEPSAKRFIDQLLWWTDVLKPAREKRK